MKKPIPKLGKTAIIGLALAIVGIVIFLIVKLIIFKDKDTEPDEPGPDPDPDQIDDSDKFSGCAQLKNKYDTLQTKYEGAHNRITRVEGERDEARSKFSEVAKELRDLKIQYDVAKDSDTYQRALAQKYKSERNAANKKAEDLQYEIDEFLKPRIEELESLTTKLNDWIEEFGTSQTASDWKTLADERKASYDALLLKYQALLKKYDRTREEVAKLEKDVNVLNKKILDSTIEPLDEDKEDSIIVDPFQFKVLN